MGSETIPVSETSFATHPEKLIKYLEFPSQFANRAGKMRQVLETQKRFVGRVMGQKNTDEMKSLLLSVSEGYDVGIELLDFMKDLLQEVANDASALREGQDMREVQQLQSDEILRLWRHLEQAKLK